MAMDAARENKLIDKLDNLLEKVDRLESLQNPVVPVPSASVDDAPEEFSELETLANQLYDIQSKLDHVGSIEYTEFDSKIRHGSNLSEHDLERLRKSKDFAVVVYLAAVCAEDSRLEETKKLLSIALEMNAAQGWRRLGLLKHIQYNVQKLLSEDVE
jgi:hypothetical protein